MRPVNVIGVASAGAWGVALANAAAAAGRGVILWGRDEARMRAIATTRRSDRLPGVDLAQLVEATSDLAELGRCDAILVAPAHSSREMRYREGAGSAACPAPRASSAARVHDQVLADAPRPRPTSPDLLPPPTLRLACRPQ
jgi:glycerol-3-phosphate dehydrogenase (NAD(P)+)